MDEGFGVKSPYGDHLWLDIRHLGEHHITTKLREIYDICTHFLGVNPIHQLIPVRPTQHYSMGGVRTDKDGHAYGLKGLFAALDLHIAIGLYRVGVKFGILNRENRLKWRKYALYLVIGLALLSLATHYSFATMAI